MLNSDRAIRAHVPYSYDVFDARHVGKFLYVSSRPTDKGSAGSKTVFLSSDGIAVARAAIQHFGTADEQYDAWDGIKVHVRLQGVSRVWANGSSQGIADGHCVALIQQKGGQKTESFGGHLTEQSLTVSCSRDFLLNHLGIDPHAYQGIFKMYLDGCRLEKGLVSLGYNRNVQNLALDCFSPTSEGGMEIALIQARALDLVSHFLRQAMASSDDDDLKDRDAAIVGKATKILQENYADPPSMDELARRLGVSASKLSKIFKKTRYRNISTTLFNVRMDEAMKLIRSGRLNISEVSFAVGYEHPSNFSSAFRRRFKISPRDAANPSLSVHGVDRN